MDGLRHDTVLPCHTINAACISSLLAATESSDLIKSKTFGSIIAGGFEFLSDMPMYLDRHNSLKYLARQVRFISI